MVSVETKTLYIKPNIIEGCTECGFITETKKLYIKPNIIEVCIECGFIAETKT